MLSTVKGLPSNASSPTDESGRAVSLEGVNTVPKTASTRAVMRLVEPGNEAMCSHCGRQVKFAARVHPRQVIANIYEGGVWKRIEHFHEECYADAGEPFGPPSELRSAQ